MTTLLDKVQELADNWMIPRLAALAVARLVAEHCAGVCEADGLTTNSIVIRAQCFVLAAAIRKEAGNLK